MEEIGPGVGDEQIVAAGAASLPLSFYRRYLSSKCTLAWVFPTSYMSLRLGYLAICPEPGSDPERIQDLESYWGRFCEHIITIREEAMDTFVLLHAAGQTFIWPVLKAFVEFGAANGFTMKESQAITLSTLESMARCLKTQDASPIGLEGMMEEYSVPASMTESGAGGAQTELCGVALRPDFGDVDDAGAGQSGRSDSLFQPPKYRLKTGGGTGLRVFQ